MKFAGFDGGCDGRHYFLARRVQHHIKREIQQPLGRIAKRLRGERVRVEDAQRHGVEEEDHLVGLGYERPVLQFAFAERLQSRRLFEGECERSRQGAEQFGVFGREAVGAVPPQ